MKGQSIFPRGDDSEVVIILTTMKNLFLQNNWAIFNHTYHKTFVEGKGITHWIIYPWATIFDICFLIEWLITNMWPFFLFRGKQRLNDKTFV